MALRKAFLALAVLALATAATALADNPTVRITAEDQAKAQASLLRLHDFSAGWKGGSVKPTPLTAPSCPGFDPKESDLVVSGHAEAVFTSGPFLLDQDAQVLESADAVATDFSRSVGPKLPDCLAYQIRAAGKGLVTNVTVKELPFPKTGSMSVAYRAVLTVMQHGHQGKFVRDVIFFGQGRYEFSLAVGAPAAAAEQLVPFEQVMVQILTKRAKVSGNVA